ncbi:MAG: murein biosynthesis integral membrane protein MurJ [Treponema sp.]|nr:murein biosynthesis integral membrane protein MurJ [Treponema sp.]
MSEQSTENKPQNNKKLIKSGISLSALTFLSRIMGLVREMTKAAFLGTSMYADAFTTAFMIPNLLRRLFAENSVSVAFIPTFKEYISKGDSKENKKDTQDFLNATFTLISFCTVIVVILGICFSPFISRIFCHKPGTVSLTARLFGMQPLNLDPVDLDVAMAEWSAKTTEITLLTRIMWPYLCLISVAALFQGILNGCRVFAPSGFTPVLLNGIIIAATYLLSPHTANPARAMSIGVVIGGFVQAVFQLPFVLKTGWKVAFTTLKKTFSNPGTKKVLTLIGPTIIGMAAYQLNDVVSTAIANNLGTGVTSSLQYSLRLQELILGIFAVSISTVILPDLSGFASKKDWVNFNEMFIQALKIITMISIPVTFYSLVTGEDLIVLLYRNKSFNDESVAMTLSVFRWHIAGLLFIAMNRIIAPAFYAQQNPKLPTTAGIISFVLNIIFAVLLAIPMQGPGIALALTLASLGNTVFLIIFMKKMESFDVKKILKDMGFYIIKIIIFSVIASAPIYFLRPVLLRVFAGHSKIVSYGLPVVITAIIFGIVGVCLLVFTGDKSTKALIRKIRK